MNIVRSKYDFLTLYIDMLLASNSCFQSFVWTKLGL